MSRATLINSGKLNEIKGGEGPECYIQIGENRIFMDILPDISDGKSAEYATESGIARAHPFVVYRNSSIRTIGWTCHFIVQSSNDSKDTKSAEKVIENIRRIQSACYPTSSDGNPPPICHLKCGKLLDNKDGVCAVLKSYSVKYDTSVPWDENSLVPYKVDIDLQFDVVYNQQELPISDKILQTGY